MQKLGTACISHRNCRCAVCVYTGKETMYELISDCLGTMPPDGEYAVLIGSVAVIVHIFTLTIDILYRGIVTLCKRKGVK